MKLHELQTITDSFVQEIHNASHGKPSSLPYIVHTTPTQPLIEDGIDFQVIVIGGSVYQNAICAFNNGTVDIKSISQGNKPVFTTKDEFLTFFDEHLNANTTMVALNFAYPMEPVFKDNVLDGILMRGTKENAFEGLVGEAVGEAIQKHVKEKTGREIKVSVANDAICTLLSGLTMYQSEEVAHGIVGTGVNFAYFIEPGKPVNLEAANFDKFPQTDIAKIVDAKSVNPGSALFEKEISGAYLYQHFNAYAEEHGLPDRIESTKDLDLFAKTCNGTGLCEFTQELLDRSAAYVAVMASAISKVKQRDMKMVMAGSLFWKAWNFRNTVEYYTAKLSPHNIEFIAIEHCEVLGAAKLLR